MSLLIELVDAGIVTLKYENDGHEPRCYCKCGGQCQPRSIYRHVQTACHQKFINPSVEILEKECGICCQKKSSFFTCATCTKGHCNECHDHIRKTRNVNSACPFCRTPFPRRKRQKKVTVLIPPRQSSSWVVNAFKRAFSRVSR